MSAALWLYLHFPNLQLDKLLLSEQRHADNNAIVISNSKDARIVQLNTIAKQHGIKAGMGIATASALYRQLQIYPYQADIEQQTILEIAQWLYLVTADISLHYQQGILIKVSDMLMLYQSLDKYWLTLKNHLDELGYQYQYCLAYSPIAARLLAQAGTNLLTSSADKINYLLGQLSLEQTDLTKKQIEQLNRVGIQYLAELIKLPLADLHKRFEHSLVTYLGQLTGQLQQVVGFYHPPEQFKQSLDLLFEISDSQKLLPSIKKLLDKLERFLYLRDKRCQQIQLQLITREKSQVQLTVASSQGEFKADKWASLVALKLESCQLPEPVIEINLQVERLLSSQENKADMFNQAPVGSLSLPELISRLQARLGDNNVLCVQLKDDHRPEQANQLTAIKADFFRHKTNDKLTGLLRPSFLFEFPKKLTEQVTIQQGPERIVCGWWDNQAVIRDYFIARSQQGVWLWIYRTPAQQWYLHGIFS
ncbi:nucleotidyltransferase/DNA polymerase involved in DNA repair [Catenovulum agarivorans DS-2]|uniref:Nucleotidyltransferase/DNA polymerase involved in DNA repair n=1 Tax=Catenovulum agarivorans DS-2 TaxID=1328313 RepID=W7QIY5_9ALTE|nr:DNA polymerase Y family protein [Catenovulum agarivorans]EWH08907.1 nucleotidyltransferase/DNA polymerase involved in DNA repair [Catenovulum agarivorans DS-2]